jgi:predicted transcriptional regulator
MGYTPGGGEERGRLAFVLVNRVNKIADGYSTARSIVLGAAIAHELGHLSSPSSTLKPGS